MNTMTIDSDFVQEVQRIGQERHSQLPDFEAEMQVLKMAEKRHAVKAFLAMGAIAVASATTLVMHAPESKMVNAESMDIQNITSTFNTGKITQLRQKSQPTSENSISLKK